MRTDEVPSSRNEKLDTRNENHYRMWHRFSVTAINAPIMNAITRSTIKITMRIADRQVVL
jgi:hypothetical protein